MTECGFDPFAINQKLFDFQQAIVRWGIRKGRAAFFEDCGLGKTAQQLEWAAHVIPAGCFRPLCYTAAALVFAALGMGIATICTAAVFVMDEKVNA